MSPDTPQPQPTLTFEDDQYLLEHLLALNESGVHPVAVGIDALHQPFLITLTEPDLAEHVFFDSPWQSDIDWTTGETYCDECTGHLHGLDDIKFPVTVMRSTTEPVLPR